MTVARRRCALASAAGQPGGLAGQVVVDETRPGHRSSRGLGSFTALFLAITRLATARNEPALQDVLWPAGAVLLVGLLTIAAGALRPRRHLRDGGHPGRRGYAIAAALERKPLVTVGKMGKGKPDPGIVSSFPDRQTPVSASDRRITRLNELLFRHGSGRRQVCDVEVGAGAGPGGRCRSTPAVAWQSAPLDKWMPATPPRRSKSIPADPRYYGWFAAAEQP